MKVAFDCERYGFELRGENRDVHHERSHSVGYTTKDGEHLLMITDETCDRQYVHMYLNDRNPIDFDVEHDVESEFDILMILARHDYLPAVIEIRKRLIDDALQDL